MGYVILVMWIFGGLGWSMLYGTPARRGLAAMAVMWPLSLVFGLLALGWKAVKEARWERTGSDAERVAEAWRAE